MFKLTFRLIAVAAAIVVPVTNAATLAPIGITDLEATELIVKLAPDQKLGATPAEVIDIVKLANAGNGTNFAVFTRLASPITARWMIHHRLPEDYLAKLQEADPDHPEWHLQQFIVLGYPTPEQRIGAEQQMKVDPAITSLRLNAKHPFSARVNDYFVQDTAPIVSERYQWALEAVKAMSPASNPSQTSGWDLARGFGYVAVVDSGIQAGNPAASPPVPMHPDLARSVRLHFSQAFYSSECPSGSLTNVDEAASSPNCPNTVLGHGTHVAGLIAATPNNKITAGPSPFHGGTA